MRVLFGLAALAAAVNGQSVAPTSNTGTLPTNPPIGATALAKIGCWYGASASGTQCSSVSPSGFINSGSLLQTNNWAIIIPNAINTLTFTFDTNTYAGQMQYRWAPGYSLGATYTCDPCSPTTCNTAVGPSSGSAGYSCANFQRTYVFSSLVASTQATQTVNSFSVQIFDIQSNPAPNVSSYSFQVVRQAPPIVGDPQIFGIQGQDFQVHGIPDEIFNMITYPNLQVNARFVYLSSGECHDNFTACFAHPGTYISEEGIRLGKDKVHVEAGSFKKGLTVSVNGKKLTERKVALKLGSVELVSHRRVVIKSPVMEIAISNSDKFLNQETALLDQKLVELGKQRRRLLVGESFHAEVPLHGLQGQTWRNVEYPSGLEYEGTIADYHVTDGNLFGTSFVYNKYKFA